MTDIKKLWQNQKTEDHMITLDDIRVRAGNFRTRTRWRNILIGGFLLLTGLAYVEGFISSLFRALQGKTAPRIWGWPLWLTFQAIGLAVFCWVLIALWRRGRARVLPAELAGEAMLEFYRRELERQRAAVASAWAWFILPFALLSAVMWVWQVLHLQPNLRPVLYINALLYAVLYGVPLGWCRYSALKLELELERLKRLRAE
jgi:hypothetical protein